MPNDASGEFNPLSYDSLSRDGYRFSIFEEMVVRLYEEGKLDTQSLEIIAACFTGFAMHVRPSKFVTDQNEHVGTIVCKLIDPAFRGDYSDYAYTHVDHLRTICSTRWFWHVI